MYCHAIAYHMALRNPPGSTPIDRLRSHYDAVEAVCPSCGYEDDSGGWEVRTDGAEIRYRHVCPSCGAAHAHTYRLTDR